ncbi:MAG: hypothetical protein VCE75_03120 [Alphaproteobacteria bacterium]
MLEINQKEGTWTVRAFIYARWRDRRLSFKPTNFNNNKRLHYYGATAFEQIEKMWHPQLSIINQLKERHTERLDVHIRRNGVVEYKELFRAKIRLDFNFRKFPFDEHSAKIEIEPFSMTQNLVRLVPGIRKSRNSSTPPNTWNSDNYRIEFSSRPEPRYDLSSDTPGAWLSPDKANEFSLMTVTLDLNREYVNFLTKKILILFVLALMMWVNAQGWISWVNAQGMFREKTVNEFASSSYFLGIIFFNHNAQNMLPPLPYLTLYKVLVIEIYAYAFSDFLVYMLAWKAGILERYILRFRLKCYKYIFWDHYCLSHGELQWLTF